MTKKCAYCGKDFTPSGHRKCYCSDECKSQFYGDMPHFEKECPQCGKLFETRYTNKIFCSAKCYLANIFSTKDVVCRD